MPSTRAYVVRRLDSVEQEVVLLKKALGSECLDRVSRKLIVLYSAWSFKKVNEIELVNYRKTLQRFNIKDQMAMIMAHPCTLKKYWYW